MPAPPKTFEDKLLAAVERYKMLSPGDRVLVAVSGGQDSLSLLHCLHRLRGRLGIELGAAHLHHGMRGKQADADVGFLRELCEALGVGFTTQTVDVPDLAAQQGTSIEEAGRQARYALFDRVARQEGYAKAALGHTATDRAETVLMNMIRGTGLQGLRGIRAVNGIVIRPLILITRTETGVYCRQHQLKPRLDCTNLDTEAYLRNRVRLKLLPLLHQEYAAGVEGALLRLAETVEYELEWTDPLAEESYEKVARVQSHAVWLDLASVQDMPAGLLARVVRRALAQLKGDLTGMTMGHVQDIVRLAREGATGARLHLPFEIYVERGYNSLTLQRVNRDLQEPGAWQSTLPIPGDILLPGGDCLSARVETVPADLAAAARCEAYVDPGAARDSLTVRAWRHGDRIAPLGMNGTKKIHDLFVDAKVPRRERSRVPVVLNCDGQVLWVAGLCVSRQAAVRADQQRCVHLVWDAQSPTGRPAEQ